MKNRRSLRGLELPNKARVTLCRLPMLFATTVDELRPGDVAVDLGQHLDEDPPLGRPAQSLGTKLIGDAGPRAAKVRFPVGR